MRVPSTRIFEQAFRRDGGTVTLVHSAKRRETRSRCGASLPVVTQNERKSLSKEGRQVAQSQNVLGMAPMNPAQFILAVW